MAAFTTVIGPKRKTGYTLVTVETPVGTYCCWKIGEHSRFSLVRQTEHSVHQLVRRSARKNKQSSSGTDLRLLKSGKSDPIFQ